MKSTAAESIEPNDVPIVPGDRLGHIRDLWPGRGTYISNGFVHSSVLGFKLIQPCNDPLSDIAEGETRSTKNSKRHRLAVIGLRSALKSGTFRVSEDPGSFSMTERLPAIGDTVWARVSKVTSKVVSADVLMSEPTTEDRIYSEPYKGQIKSHDIRSYDIDSMKTAACYRAGDVIRAVVISTGDTRGGFLLTTAPAECGVVFGKSVAGGRLEPISYQFMQCDKTRRLETRKVARPIGNNPHTTTAEKHLATAILNTKNETIDYSK